MRATAVWFLLIGATLVSYALGTHHGVGTARLAGTLILLVAFTKAYLIGLYFMELRGAPTALRLIFTGYCGVVFAAVAGLYLVTG